MLKTFPYDGQGVVYGQGSDYMSKSDIAAWDSFVLNVLDTLPEGQKAHVVYDARAHEGIAITLSNGLDAFHFLHHPRLDWIVMIAPPDSVQAQTSGLLAHLHRIKNWIVPTPAAAETFLREQDPALVWQDVF